MNPLVSIIIPVYNGEKFIEETVNSVLEQTHANWELYLIDDGSQDQSAKICTQLSDKYDRIYYYKKENGGQGSARNLGIRHAKGEYIAFLDADDLWDKKKIEQQLLVFKENLEIDFVYASGKVFYEDLSNTEAYPAWRAGIQKGCSWKRELFQRSAIINSSVIAKSEIFTEKFMFDEADLQKGTEDWDLWLRLALNDHVFYGMEAKLVYYREHGDGIHRQLERMFKGKAHTYLKHKNTPHIPSWLKRKQFRFVYRELMNIHRKKNKWETVIEDYNLLKREVKWSFGDMFLWLIQPISTPKVFYIISSKVIFRIAYQFEKIAYIFRK